jgi:hypothetical protein
MNLLLLPKELQDLISMFNVGHRPIMRVVMNELLIKYKQRKEDDEYCVNCCGYAEEKYSRYIFWNKYSFCGEWCKYDTDDIRDTDDTLFVKDIESHYKDKWL